MAAGYVPFKAYHTESLHRTDKQVLHANYLGDIPEQGDNTEYRFTAPRFTAANFLPQIGLNMHVVNKQNPDLPRMFHFPKTRGKSGFYCIILMQV